jgi:hypothetical protein
MSRMFSGVKAPDIPPKVVPPRNTGMDAELAALARRQGASASILTGPGGMRAGTPITGSKTLTGS